MTGFLLAQIVPMSAVLLAAGYWVRRLDRAHAARMAAIEAAATAGRERHERLMAELRAETEAAEAEYAAALRRAGAEFVPEEPAPAAP